MIGYIIKRLLWFIPGIFIISCIAFVISLNGPGNHLEVSKTDQVKTGIQNSQQDAAIMSQWRERLGLDLPVFYFSLNTLSAPPSNMTVNLNAEEKKALEQLTFESGNAERSRHMQLSFASMWMVLAADTGRVEENKKELAMIMINSLKTADNQFEIDELMTRIRKIEIFDPAFNQKYRQSEQVFRDWRIESSHWRSWVPCLRFHSDNQYHRWLFGDPYGISKGVIRGDFGRSLLTKLPVSETIFSRLKWSSALAMFSLLIAFAVSIPVGVWAGANPGGWFDRFFQIKLFILYCIPGFWMGTLLLVLFANPDVLPWFPASGVTPPGGFPTDLGFLDHILATIPYLVLPLLCYTYASFAFTTRIIRNSVRDHMSQDHIRTAKAKGLPMPTIAFKHALKNALIPAITVFAEALPLAVSGSVIIETLFSIPGMGFETVQAALNRDYPVIIAVCTLSALLTMTGSLIADVLYVIVDPRIKLNRGTHG